MYLIENACCCLKKDFGIDMKAREGDLVETFDGNIFDVKGLVHPWDRIIAFIRFTPDQKGERRRGNTLYKKIYPLHERYELLCRKFPQYLVFDPVFNQWLCEVPVEMVKKHHKPSLYLAELRGKRVLDKLEQQTVDFAELLVEEARVKWDALGVSGSLLVGLHTAKSDIDLIVYGSQNCFKVYNALGLLFRDDASGVKLYDRQDLKALFDFRSKDTLMKFEDFVRTESRKVLQGKFHGRDYFIRCVKDWKEVNETYGLVHYEPVGNAMIDAAVSDDSQMIFTPCIYKIEDVHVRKGKNVQYLREVASFRGRFCEQARNGENIIAQGMVERVIGQSQEEYFRLLLGNEPSDFMILAR